MKTEERSRRHKPKESRIISLSETNTVVSWGYFLFVFNFFICLCFAYMHVYKPHMLLVPSEAKRGLCIPCEQVLDRREPSVGAGNQPWYSAKTTSALSCWAITALWGYFLLNMSLLTYYCVWCGGGGERGVLRSCHREGRRHIRRVVFLLLSLSSASGHSEVRQPPNVKHHWE